MNPLPRTTFPAELASLGLIRDYVKAAATAAALGKAASYQLMLAVDEIATNVLVHGYEEKGRTGDLAIASSLEARKLQLVLEDTGEAFDPRTLALPDAEAFSQPLEDRPIGGLGIYLAFAGVDRFDYRREGDRNFNIFEVNLDGTP